MESNAAIARLPEELTCSVCHTSLSGAQDRVGTQEGEYCRPCFNNLKSERDRALQEQGRDINYPMALVGALLGGTAGILAWWLITVWTQTAFGIVAILIGLAVGKGTTLLAGNKLSRGLQVMSLSVAGCSYLYASYLVNRSFMQQALAAEGQAITLTLLPNPEMLFRVVSLNFDVLSLLFLAIVLWQAWKLPAPVKLP